MSDGPTERRPRESCYDTIGNRRMLREHHSPIYFHLSLRNSTWDQIEIWRLSVCCSLILDTVRVDTAQNQGESKLWDQWLRIDLIWHCSSQTRRVESSSGDLDATQGWHLPWTNPYSGRVAGYHNRINGADCTIMTECTRICDNWWHTWNSDKRNITTKKENVKLLFLLKNVNLWHSLKMGKHDKWRIVTKDENEIWVCLRYCDRN